MNWKHRVSDIVIKLNRANALLFKIRNFINVKTLKAISFVIFDSHINYANVIWAQNSNAVNRVSILRKRPWELLVFSQKIVIHTLCLKSKIYLNLMIKVNFKMYSSSVNTLIIWPYQFSTTGSYFVLIYIIITQLPPLQVNYSSPHSEKIYMEKNSITISAFNRWNKLQTQIKTLLT